MKVLIDNGHGKNTPKKNSPPGMLAEPGQVALYEFELVRDIVCRMEPHLKRRNIEYEILVPEVEDISLKERVRRANEIHAKEGDVFLISVHSNNNEVPNTGTGFEFFTSPGQTESDVIAEFFGKRVKKAFPEHGFRKDTADGDTDKEANFYILRKTTCPTVLIECLFYDNEKDLADLLKDEFRERLAKFNVDCIADYIKSKSK